MINNVSGATPDIVVTSSEVLSYLRNNAEIKKQYEYDLKYVNTENLEVTPKTYGKVSGGITIGDLTFYAYDATYVDQDGKIKRYIPEEKLVMFSRDELLGTQLFAAIKDLKSLTPARYFPKMWEQEDPSAAAILTQSAPLIVPMRSNASLVATVL